MFVCMCMLCTCVLLSVCVRVCVCVKRPFCVCVNQFESRTPQPRNVFEARLQNGARLAHGGRPYAYSDVGFTSADHDLPDFRDDLSLHIAPDENATLMPPFAPSVMGNEEPLFTSTARRGAARKLTSAATPLMIESVTLSPSSAAAERSSFALLSDVHKHPSDAHSHSREGAASGYTSPAIGPSAAHFPTSVSRSQPTRSPPASLPASTHASALMPAIGLPAQHGTLAAAPLLRLFASLT
jgi:hypothetical protein